MDNEKHTENLGDILAEALKQQAFKERFTITTPQEADAAFNALTDFMSTRGWRRNNQPDPFADQDAYHRDDPSGLCMGFLSDDALANAGFMCDHRTSLQSMAYLTAMKERIRWLSRALARARTLPDDLFTHKDAWRAFIRSSRDTAEENRIAANGCDEGDAAYAQHELEVFDRTWATLEARPHLVREDHNGWTNETKA